MSNFKKDSKTAIRVFEKNREAIEKLLPPNSSNLFNIECDSKILMSKMDTNASLDMFVMIDELLYGVALRINYNKNHHNSITIRYHRSSGAKTEFEKTVKAIENEAITPKFGIQVDVDDDFKMVNAIYFDRIKLFKWCIENPDKVRRLIEVNHEDKNSFFKLEYQYMDKFGFTISKIIKK